MTTTKQSAVAEQEARTGKLREALAGARRALNLVLLYEDTATRKWAGEAAEWVQQLAGDNPVRPMWWKLDNLSEPAVLAGAVSTSRQADVIIVCTLASEGLPLPFYVWVHEWVRHRPRKGGALVALLGLPERARPSLGRVREYLRAVAGQARMVFVAKERRLRAAENEV